MFRYFCKHRCNYEKGQLAPFFIALLVILIIMAMVTVNISKVGFIKTESANAVDSGGLAAGSVMANLFNALAKANRDMQEAYRQFFQEISLMFSMAVEYLTSGYVSAYDSREWAKSALGAACNNPCAALYYINNAIYEMQNAIYNIESLITVIENQIKPELTDFHQKQFDFYLDIRATAADAWCKAQQMGHRFVFSNSGIGEKLKSRDDFNTFLENLQCAKRQIYLWTDGQGRGHFVESVVTIAPVEKFELRVTENTYSQEIQDLDEILETARSALVNLNNALNDYGWAAVFLWLACYVAPPYCIFAIPFIIFGIQETDIAMDTLKPLFADVPDAWVKLLLREDIFLSETDDDSEDEILGWIDEIVHERLVRVDTTQSHEGKEEQGIWVSRYPETRSYSVVDFRGQGQIYRPLAPDGTEGQVLRHNPSIIETDKAE